MSFTIICNECGSKNVIAISTTDMEVTLICQECGDSEEY
jgi:transcription elongation factor Elf1